MVIVVARYPSALQVIPFLDGDSMRYCELEDGSVIVIGHQTDNNFTGREGLETGFPVDYRNSRVVSFPAPIVAENVFLIGDDHEFIVGESDLLSRSLALDGSPLEPYEGLPDDRNSYMAKAIAQISVFRRHGERWIVFVSLHTFRVMEGVAHFHEHRYQLQGFPPTVPEELMHLIPSIEAVVKEADRLFPRRRPRTPPSGTTRSQGQTDGLVSRWPQSWRRYRSRWLGLRAVATVTLRTDPNRAFDL